MKRYFDKASPNIKWDLGINLGKPFEEFVADIIKLQLQDFHPRIKVQQTSYCGDGGKDVIVTSEINNFTVLGQRFTCSGKKNITIFFECKSTDNDVLRYDKISSSSSRAQFQDIDYYVLVTNSTVLPQTCWYISEELSTYGIKFMLIDSFLLGKAINELNIKNCFNNPYEKSDSADFYYEYQVEPLVPQQKNKYNIYLACRNYSNTQKHCTIKLKTDVDWNISNNVFSFLIPPQGIVTKRITVEQSHYDGIPELLFNIQINGTESILMIKGIQGLQIFEPPFFGDKRKDLIKNLEQELKSSNKPNIICFWGEAGIGKTRVVKELLIKLQGTYFDFYDCRLQKGKSPEKDIQKFLINNNYIKKQEYKNLSEMFLNCKKDFWKTPIIVFDDFHNASKDFIEQIKSLRNLSTGAVIIICGRTDFSVGDINYLSFISWIKSEIPKYCFEIEPLSDNETRRFIKVLIDGIPEYALEKLFALSMKNPLFIIQYIEYLLDCDLVRLQNRNTVGIVDVNKFHLNKYMPKKVSNIYKLRIENLLKCERGTACLRLLYKLSFCNGKISSEFFCKFFEVEYDELGELLKRRLVKYDPNGDITFIHESLYLYIKKSLEDKKRTCKSIAINLLENIDLPRILNSFQMGKVYLYAHEYENARRNFNPIKDWISNVDNISNVNVNIEYYEYLYDVFELFVRKNGDVDIAKRALLMRVYITLHHFAPINAVNECDKVLSKLKKFKCLEDKKFRISILELKAHALMNSGLYPDGEILLKEIQAQWLCDKTIMDNGTLFDLYDRLTSVYRHFNLKELAIRYSTLSINLADNLNDAKLQMLANRTKYKLYLYVDEKSRDSALQKSIAMNKIVPSKRIKTDNDLDLCGLELLANRPDKLDDLIQRINTLLEYIEANNFSRAKIHGYFLLAICNLLKGTETALRLAKEYTDKAIGLSTSYGIVGYLWRLNNLNAIIEMRLNFDGEKVYKSFNTVFEILKSRGLLYIGNRDLCHGNILALSNIGYYFQEHKFESQFYEKMALVTYTGKGKYTYTKDDNEQNSVHTFLVHQYNQAKNKLVLFVDSQPTGLLRDPQTDYFIIL